MRVEKKMRQAARGQAEKRPDWDGRPGFDRQMNKALLFEIHRMNLTNFKPSLVRSGWRSGPRVCPG